MPWAPSVRIFGAEQQAAYEWQEEKCPIIENFAEDRLSVEADGLSSICRLQSTGAAAVRLRCRFRVDIRTGGGATGVGALV